MQSLLSTRIISSFTSVFLNCIEIKLTCSTRGDFFAQIQNRCERDLRASIIYVGLPRRLIQS